MAARKKKAKKTKAAAKRAPARKTKAPARKAKRGAKKSAKKTVKRPAKKTKAAAKKAPARKAPPRTKKQDAGEGDYAASRAFLKDQASFVEKNKGNIPAMGRQAKEALEGPDGDDLRNAEATAAARSRDEF